jgi:methyl-accepting chemotaxis protein
MKNFSIGKKIGFGFGALLFIALSLGALALFNMRDVKGNAQTLATEFVPETQIADDFGNALARMQLAVRSYGLTADNNYLEVARKSLAEVQTSFKAAQKLADEHPQLVKLRDHLKELEPLLKAYEQAITDTVAKNQEIVSDREKLNQAANDFIANIDKLIQGQEEKLNKEIEAFAEVKKLEERVHKLMLITQIRGEGNAARIAVFKSQALRDPKIIEEGFKNFEEMEKKFAELVALLKSQEDIDELNRVKADAFTYREAMKGIMVNYVALTEIGRKRAEIADQTTLLADETATTGMTRTIEAANVSSQKLTSASTVLTVGLLVALVIGMVLALVLSKMITTPLREAVELVKQVAQGDLTVSAQAKSKDEIGQMISALNSMIENVRNVVDEVTQAAGNVASGSEQMSATAQQLSQGASEQAAVAEETTSSMEEMGSSIQQNADNAKQTEKIASKAATDAKTGGESVAQTVAAMKEIAEKITIIEEIARKTDLLALNAAVEAARAGEHGKGFAVVASEVRKLAERSQAAAADINKLTTSGVNVAQNAGDMLLKLVPDIRKTAELVQEIAAASAEQNSGAAQVNKAIQQLDQVIQQNASASEEVAASSEELSSQAQQLQAAIAFFKVDHAGTTKTATTVSRRKAAPAPSAPSLAQSKPAHKPLATDHARATKLGGATIEIGDHRSNGHADHQDQEFTKY